MRWLLFGWYRWRFGQGWTAALVGPEVTDRSRLEHERSTMMSKIQSRRHLATLLVCGKGCCCGQREKGRAPVPVAWLQEQWAARELEHSLKLMITDCLGPCDQANVICLKQGMVVKWLGGLGESVPYETLVAWATASHAAGELLPLPGLLNYQDFRQLADPDRATHSGD